MGIAEIFASLSSRCAIFGCRTAQSHNENEPCNGRVSTGPHGSLPGEILPCGHIGNHVSSSQTNRRPKKGHLSSWYSSSRMTSPLWSDIHQTRGSVSDISDQTSTRRKRSSVQRLTRSPPTKSSSRGLNDFCDPWPIGLSSVRADSPAFGTVRLSLRERPRAERFFRQAFVGTNRSFRAGEAQRVIGIAGLAHHSVA